MNRKTQFALNEYYHIYNRGVEKRDIFLESGDWDRFQKTLFFLNHNKPVNLRDVRNKSFTNFERDPLVALGAYCLMPNHFHILVREVENGGISKFMSKLMTSHSKYFNTKHNRVGHLFQDRFRAEHVNRDEYLKYLYTYIHLNPVKLIEPNWKEKGLKQFTKTKDFLGKFTYSSYVDYIGEEREEGLILDREAFPAYFDSTASFHDFADEWLVMDSE